MNPTGLSRVQCVLIWIALLVLLGLTVGLANLNLGPFNNVVALSVAVAQMLLVVLFFMHVRYEKPITWIFVCAGLIWLLLMFNFVLADYMTRPTPIHYILHNRVGLGH